ncbi:hypothetical protein CYMTET_52143 [Cymbomonas tetramitiformis]|uniref:Uncharacterized protein n=1 Tax=Cymbomonas tetramitiformis TaxID=36881 RepID=A0AAE0BJL1_9CHLO|nr:hypothetical protein CYMTET_52143 [Cymbomonas tetramitiformis]
MSSRKTQSKAFVVAQGNSLFRVLSRSENDQLRHYEVAVLEKVTGTRMTNLPDRSFHYFAVTDSKLVIVERQGKVPRKVVIDLALITAVEEDSEECVAFNEENIASKSKRLFFYRRGPGVSSSSSGAHDGNEDTISSGDRDVMPGTSGQAPSPVRVSSSGVWNRLFRSSQDLRGSDTSQGQHRRSKSEQLNMSPLPNGTPQPKPSLSPTRRLRWERGARHTEPVVAEECLSVITLESPSMLFYHLFRAWMHLKMCRHRRRHHKNSSGDVLLFLSRSHGKSVWSSCKEARALASSSKSVQVRELFEDLKADILRKCSPYEVGDVMAAQDLSLEAEGCMALRRFFFTSHELFCLLVRRLAYSMLTSDLAAAPFEHSRGNHSSLSKAQRRAAGKLRHCALSITSNPNWGSSPPSSSAAPRDARERPAEGRDTPTYAGRDTPTYASERRGSSPWCMPLAVNGQRNAPSGIGYPNPAGSRSGVNANESAAREGGGDSRGGRRGSGLSVGSVTGSSQASESPHSDLPESEFSSYWHTDELGDMIGQPSDSASPLV